MTNPTEFLKRAIENAKDREAAIRAERGPRRFAGHASGSTETPLGRIKVDFVVAAGRTTIRPESMRQTWKLDGKRIARDKLIEMLRG